ncbi:glycosyltransferase family 4 protein [Caulobacter flavus]|uniref:glycosyltransferase family 4 protein n=1 Tax=Caulobacter flavus TaxID=1679497 RepID=UPI0013DDEC28|nr:glycosyltransferase family 1 protein [Caulobacter flavus]
MARYAAVLAQTLETLGAPPAFVRDAAPSDARAQNRLAAWLRAQRAGVRRLRPAGDDQTWTRRDLFAEAQSYFNRHGRLMELTVPDPPTVMHWTYPVPLAMTGTRNLYTIHDLIPLQRPDLTGVDPRRHRRLLEAVATRADHLVAVSEHTRRALIEILGASPHRVTNTWQASPDAERNSPAEWPPLPPGLVEKGYFVAVGAIDPRKNLTRLAAAWRAAGAPLPLVIVGPDGWRAETVLKGLPSDPRLIRLPWLERRALLALIARARALLFPSLAEGFGLPALEAMHLGAPVLASAEDGLAEVVGDGGLLVAPEDEAALAAAIGRLAGDDRLRETLIRAGSKRALAFSHHAYGRRLAALYQAVADQSLAPLHDAG